MKVFLVTTPLGHPTLAELIETLEHYAQRGVPAIERRAAPATLVMYVTPSVAQLAMKSKTYLLRTLDVGVYAERQITQRLTSLATTKDTVMS